MGEELKTILCRGEDGLLIKVLERRGNYGSAHNSDGVLADPRHYVKYQTVEGITLTLTSDGRLRDPVNGRLFTIVS